MKNSVNIIIVKKEECNIGLFYVPKLVAAFATKTIIAQAIKNLGISLFNPIIK